MRLITAALCSRFEGRLVVSYFPSTLIASFGHCRVGETAAGFRHPASSTRLLDLPAEELARIRKILRKLTAVRVQNVADAEDLVQDTLLTMVMKHPEGGLNKGLLVWGMGILRRKVGNYYKKSQRQAAGNLEKAVAWQTIQLRTHAVSPESEAHHTELRTLIQQILAGFPLSEQAAMKLHLAGLPAHEIAGELHPEPYQNVINRIYRGRKKLARELRKHGY